MVTSVIKKSLVIYDELANHTREIIMLFRGRNINVRT